MSTSLLQGALRDENGQGDIAYIAMGGLGLAVLGPVLVMTAMSVVAHFRCVPQVFTVKDVVTIIKCDYDPQPLGTAIGLACGGFGVALAALAGYMAATRRAAGSSTTTTKTETKIEPVAATATAANPMPVEVTNVDPVPVIDTPKRKPRKRAR